MNHILVEIWNLKNSNYFVTIVGKKNMALYLLTYGKSHIAEDTYQIYEIYTHRKNIITEKYHKTINNST